MANRIRGITVEIGGDVTKLDKALEGTNKQLSSTQRQLKDVEKLLKFDPGNVELLEQKQRLLAQAVEGTTDKLKSLQQVADTSTVSNVKYEQWQKALSSLQGQITKTANEVAKFEKTAKDLEDLGFSPDSSQVREFTDKAEAARKKLDELKQSVTSTYEELGRPISIDQWDALQREMSEAAYEAQQAQDAFDEFSPALSRAADIADKVADKAGKVADATKGISLAAGGALTALGGLAVKAGMSADDLNTLSKQTGFSTQTLQEWQYASNFVDVSVEDIVGSARKLKQNMDSTSEDVVAAWKKLGVGFRDADGFRDVEYVFNDVLMGLSQIPNETERDIVAMTLFGRSADQLAGIIDDGGEALRQFGKEAQDAGLILSQDALDSANQFNDALDRLKETVGGKLLQLGSNLAEALLPGLEKLVDAIVPLLDWITQLDQGTLKFIVTALALTAAISPVAKLISNIASGVSQIITFVSMHPILSAVLLVVAAVAVLILKWDAVKAAAKRAFDAIGGFIENCINSIDRFLGILIGEENWEKFKENCKKTIEAIVGFIQKGVDAVKRFFGVVNEGGGGGSSRRDNAPGGSTSPFSSDPTFPVGTPSTGGYPAFASGGVFAPNSPMLGVLGDHPTEYEVAAPESMLRDTFLDALSSSGLLGRGAALSGNQPVILNMDGRTFARLFVPYLKAEYNRLGIDLLNR